MGSTRDCLSFHWQLLFFADCDFVQILGKAISFAAFLPARCDDEATLLLWTGTTRDWVSVSHWDIILAFGSVLKLSDSPEEMVDWLSGTVPSFIFLSQMWERVFSALTRGGLLSVCPRPTSKGALRAAIWSAARSISDPSSSAPHPLLVTSRDLDPRHPASGCLLFPHGSGYGPGRKVSLCLFAAPAGRYLRYPLTLTCLPGLLPLSYLSGLFVPGTLNAEGTILAFDDGIEVSMLGAHLRLSLGEGHSTVGTGEAVERAYPVLIFHGLIDGHSFASPAWELLSLLLPSLVRVPCPGQVDGCIALAAPGVVVSIMGSEAPPYALRRFSTALFAEMEQNEATRQAREQGAVALTEGRLAELCHPLGTRARNAFLSPLSPDASAEDVHAPAHIQLLLDVKYARDAAAASSSCSGDEPSPDPLAEDDRGARYLAPRRRRPDAGNHMRLVRDRYPLVVAQSARQPPSHTPRGASRRAAGTCANHHLLIKTVPGTLGANATIAIHGYPLRDTTQTICLSLSRQPERDACVAVMGGECGFFRADRGLVVGSGWSVSRPSFWFVIGWSVSRPSYFWCYVVGGAYRACHFGGCL